jgi:DNA-binding transcriptional regulator YiaG
VIALFDMKKVGKQIALLRKEKKITQMALADLMGVSFQAISNWERGRRCRIYQSFLSLL